MKKITYYLLSVAFISTSVFAQEQEGTEFKPGHQNTNKFKQLYDEFSTPNMYRAASGAPGVAYYQQQADYKMDIELDDKNARIYGYETITYTNNSPDVLEYLWVSFKRIVHNRICLDIVLQILPKQIPKVSLLLKSYLD